MYANMHVYIYANMYVHEGFIYKFVVIMCMCGYNIYFVSISCYTSVVDWTSGAKRKLCCILRIRVYVVYICILIHMYVYIM